MIKFALDGITSFSTMPLRIATWMGYVASSLAFLYLATVFVQWVLGITVQGWATTMVALLFLGGTQLICLGIIGEYVGRIFAESKGRPLYIVETVLGDEGSWTDETALPVPANRITAASGPLGR
jgi:dolichol-phosphate mannosyltransferase